MRTLIAVESDEDAAVIIDAVAPWLRHTGSTAILLRVIDPHETERTVAGAEGHSPVAPDDEPRMAIGLNEPQAQSIEDRTQAIDRVETAARERLSQVAALSLSGVAHEIHVALAANAAQTIVQEALNHHADAIAIGTHGRSGLRHTALGNVTDAVVRAAPVPVFLVKEKAGVVEDANAAESIAQAEVRGRRVADHREEEVDPLVLGALIDSQRDDP